MKKATYERLHRVIGKMTLKQAAKQPVAIIRLEGDAIEVPVTGISYKDGIPVIDIELREETTRTVAVAAKNVQKAAAQPVAEPETEPKADSQNNTKTEEKLSQQIALMKRKIRFIHGHLPKNQRSSMSQLWKKEEKNPNANLFAS